MMHDIKIRRKFYDAILEGRKKSEVRKDDRHYRVGDLIRFHVINYGGFGIIVSNKTFEITHKLTHDDFPEGIPEGYCVLSIREHGRIVFS